MNDIALKLKDLKKKLKDLKKELTEERDSALAKSISFCKRERHPSDNGRCKNEGAHVNGGIKYAEGERLMTGVSWKRIKGQPEHYTFRGGMTVRELCLNAKEVMPYDIQNILKYLYRAPEKGGFADYAKLRNYLEDLRRSCWGEGDDEEGIQLFIESNTWTPAEKFFLQNVLSYHFFKIDVVLDRIQSDFRQTKKANCI